LYPNLYPRYWLRQKLLQRKVLFVILVSEKLSCLSEIPREGVFRETRHSHALGLAQKGHSGIADVQTWPQVTALREKARSLSLETLRVEKLDLLDSYDVAHPSN
jgi:hypothetical protein